MEEREREGGRRWTRGPGSTSTHLNFGPSQGQCDRPHPPCPLLSSFFFLLLLLLLLLLLILLLLLLLCLPAGPVPHYRVIPCWDPRPPPFCFTFFPSLSAWDPAKSQLVEILHRYRLATVLNGAPYRPSYRPVHVIIPLDKTGR